MTVEIKPVERAPSGPVYLRWTPRKGMGPESGTIHTRSSRRPTRTRCGVVIPGAVRPLAEPPALGAWKAWGCVRCSMSGA